MYTSSCNKGLVFTGTPMSPLPVFTLNPRLFLLEILVSLFYRPFTVHGDPSQDSLCVLIVHCYLFLQEPTYDFSCHIDPPDLWLLHSYQTNCFYYFTLDTLHYSLRLILVTLSPVLTITSVLPQLFYSPREKSNKISSLFQSFQTLRTPTRLKTV